MLRQHFDGLGLPRAERCLSCPATTGNSGHAALVPNMRGCCWTTPEARTRRNPLLWCFHASEPVLLFVLLRVSTHPLQTLSRVSKVLGHCDDMICVSFLCAPRSWSTWNRALHAMATITGMLSQEESIQTAKTRKSWFLICRY